MHGEAEARGASDHAADRKKRSRPLGLFLCRSWRAGRCLAMPVRCRDVHPEARVRVLFACHPTMLMYLTLGQEGRRHDSRPFGQILRSSRSKRKKTADPKLKTPGPKLKKTPGPR